MSGALFDVGVRRKTVRLTINADPLEKAAAAAINASRTAQEELVEALK